MLPSTVLAMSPDVQASLHAEGALDRLEFIVGVDTDRVVDDFTDPAHAAVLATAEVLFTHWGCPPLTAEALSGMPKLRAVVHAAGSVKGHVTDAVWERGILVSTAAQANAQPVAEYTVAAILFMGKRVFATAAAYRDRLPRANPHVQLRGAGNYGITVGIVGASRIGRRVMELLRPYDVTVLLHDPYLTATEAAGLGVAAIGLDELVRGSDVVTIHAPQLPETRHMFDAERLSLLRDGATLINTARGSLVDTEALTKEVVSGRLNAVIDVTEPEWLPADSPLFGLPNVLLTPHIAGSLGNELRRMTDVAVDELLRYAAGRPFAHPVDPLSSDRSA